MIDPMEIAQKIADENGLSIIDSNDPNITAKIKGDGICLVIYLHKTSADNYHYRVRDENSKRPSLALEIATKMDTETGLNCTFQMKNESLRRLRIRAESENHG